MRWEYHNERRVRNDVEENCHGLLVDVITYNLEGPRKTVRISI